MKQSLSIFAMTMMLVSCVGCASTMLYPGKYGSVLYPGASQEDVQRRIGTPVYSTANDINWRDRTFRRSDAYDDAHPFDVFLVHGKILERDSPRQISYTVSSVLTLTLAEVILIPCAAGLIAHDIFTDRYLKVWYKDDFHYQNHRTIELDEVELREPTE